MQKSLYKTIVILTTFFICLSCESEDKNLVAKPEVNQQNKELLENKYRLLDYSVNPYYAYFKKTDNTIGFNNLKADFNKKYSFVEHVDFKNGKKNNLSLNNKRIQPDNLKNSLSVEESDIYGKKVTFKLNSTKSSTESEQIEMYIPEKLFVTSPVSIKNKSIPAYYKNFKLKWNADPKNQNGLMIAVEYFGETVGKKETGDHLQIIDYIDEDDGEYTVDENMFEDIPNLSFVDVILLRGNIDINEIDGESWKTYAEAHQRIPIILIKDLNTIFTSNE